MKKGLIFAASFLGLFLLTVYIFPKKISHNYSNRKSAPQQNKALYVIADAQEQGLTPFPENEHTRRIVARTDIEHEAFDLAKKGYYEEAILKYREAMDPSLLNSSGDENGGRYGIVKILIRQGKFDEALREYQWFIDANEKGPFSKDVGEKYTDITIDQKLELEALITARNTNSNESIYNHIQYLRNKYKKYIPPSSLDAHSFGSGPMNQIIHLFNWMNDMDGGIAFVNEILSSEFLYPLERNEYERVKSAFLSMKQAGQKGQFQEVVATSDLIGW